MKISDLSPTARKRLFLILVTVMPIVMISVAITAVSSTVQAPIAQDAVLPSLDVPTLALSSAIVMSVSALAAGYALKGAGTAAISALVEKPEQFFKAFLVVTLCETIAIYGVVIAVLLWLRIP
ncbi:MAG: ATP synthase subunit C [Candidatus Methanomethyliaceae archaeon]|nr:ATP synthase subunit C [Candidatus Methanomethyliaceae archaeon]MDD1766852.1 ATP synthase subunit C [Candidatus Methanomethyliaceae archaeon]